MEELRPEEEAVSGNISWKNKLQWENKFFKNNIAEYTIC
jgi:hypothetical protein